MGAGLPEIRRACGGVFGRRLRIAAASGHALVRHVAFWNRYVCDCLLGESPDPSLNELPAEDYATKEKMIQALRQSAESVLAVMRERGKHSEMETAELVVPFLEHTAEHYGQLVIYARLRGITPPASRA
jgi:hypothetical protein